MRRSKKIVKPLLCLAFYGWAVMLCAQAFLPYFQYIEQVDGQPAHADGNIVQDEMGFIWIPSGRGLLRYDGYELKPFLRAREDTGRVVSENIKNLQLGRGGLIYILTDYEGFSIFDPKTGRFKNWQPNASDTVGFFTRKINRVEEEGDGSLWLCHRGFHHWHPEKGTIDHYYPSEMLGLAGTEAKAADDVRLLRNDPGQQRYLWIGTRLGLMRFDKRTKRLEHYPIDNEEIDVTTNSSRDLYFGADGKIYVGTWYHGLQVFDTLTHEWEVHYFFGKRHSRELNNSVSRIDKKSPHELWVVAPYMGLFTFNTSTEQFQLISPHFENTTLPKSSPYCLQSEPLGFLQDRDGANWIYQNHGGMEVMPPQQQQFKKVATGTTIRKVVPEPGTDRLYLPAGEGKLHLFDRNTEKLETFPVEKKMFREDLRSGAFFSDGQPKFLGLNTLYRLLPNGKVVPETLQPFDSLQLVPGMFDNSHAWCFLEDSQQNLWLPLKREGILKIHLPTGKYTKQLFSHEAFGKNFNWGFPGDIIETAPHRVWVSCHEGVCFTDDAGETWTQYPFTSPSDKQVEFREITSMQADKKGRLWMGSGRNGLFYLYPDQPHPQALHALTVRDGLPGEHIYDLELDANGHLWLVTDMGLSKMVIDKLTFENFGPEYGLHGLRELTLLPSGEMAIAADGGFYLFHPDSVHIDTTPYLPVIHGFGVIGGEFKVDTAIQYLSEINLKHNQNFFTFEFSAPNFWAPQLVRYQYQLVGVDPGWVDAGERRFANYTDISPGHYNFLVRASNVRGEWNKASTSMDLLIAPPWWATWWAYTVYLLALSAALYGFYRFQLRRKLAEAEARRLQELDEVKTKLYTNITHEFRTPLTIILGMARQVLDNPKDHFRSGLEIILRNGQNLSQLVNQMLDLSKLESGNMQLQLHQGEVIGFLRYLTESFHSLAESKKIKLVFLSETKELFMDFDSQKLQQILTNLLSNAVKFTPEGGHVSVMAKAASQTLLLKVADTGIGIPKEKLPHIFDRFFQVVNSPTRHGEGTGIGLALTKELVKLMGGEIAVKSPVSGQVMGSEFTVKIPIENKASKMDKGEWVFPSERLLPALPMTTGSYNYPTTQPSNHPTLLLIEDNPDVLAYLGSCLNDDYHLTTATDGQMGIDLALETTPDLIISDVMMPQKDGFEVCHFLKNDERTSHIPVILLTAKADLASKLEGIEQGADAYLAKPFHKEELLLRTRKLLELRQQLQHHFLRMAGLSEISNGHSPINAPTAEDVFVKKVHQVVEDHLDDFDFTVETLCREIGMSHSQLHRKLIALTGLSSNKFIRSVRLLRAKELLADPALTITAVAFDTGFSDPGYFSKVFKKEFGETPAEWRERQ